MTMTDPFTDPPVRKPRSRVRDASEDRDMVMGPLEEAVRGDIDGLGLVSPTARSMAELSYNLARKLDDGAGMATAAVAKELRETLAAMAEEAGDDDGAELLKHLSSPMGNTTAS